LNINYLFTFHFIGSCKYFRLE